MTVDIAKALECRDKVRRASVHDLMHSAWPTWRSTPHAQYALHSL